MAKAYKRLLGTSPKIDFKEGPSSYKTVEQIMKAIKLYPQTHSNIQLLGRQWYQVHKKDG
mgnify:FL=1